MHNKLEPPTHQPDEGHPFWVDTHATSTHRQGVKISDGLGTSQSFNTEVHGTICTLYEFVAKI